MKTHVLRKDQRGTKDIGWLLSKFSFSFSNYQDPTNRGFGLLKALNDDLVQPGQGFGTHPHINMEIISVMLAGNMSHKDSIGYDEVVTQDWVQIMSAGAGLTHSEYNVGQDTVNFLQIWIEPKVQNIPPRYQRRYFPKAERKNQLKTVISSGEGLEHCWINQYAKLSLGYYDSGQTIDYHFKHHNRCVYVYLMKGKLDVAGEIIDERDGIGLWQTDEFAIKTLEESEFIVIEVPINQ